MRVIPAPTVEAAIKVNSTTSNSASVIDELVKRANDPAMQKRGPAKPYRIVKLKRPDPEEPGDGM